MNVADVDMSSQTEAAAAFSDMQDQVPVSGTGSAHPPLPKMHSWGASGLQGLFKQPSAGILQRPNVVRNAQKVLACSHHLRRAACRLHIKLVHLNVARDHETPWHARDIPVQALCCSRERHLLT